MNFVLDASVTLAWCFEDEGGEYAERVLGALRTSGAVAASLWPLEVANGLAVAERRGRLDATDARRFMDLVLALPIAVDPTSRAAAMTASYDLARRRTLSAYDASYLELALRLGIPLATLDVRLREAAQAEGVRLFGG